ncbi:Abortive infection protein AbiGII [Streptococcus oralis]|uniref:Abortive infection protein AbiGII n=1 Tax=Streptococcus oralis TaxID=1303 RepID=A0A139RJW9_STROR|nr:nucleotidyl transferase AbiEii/AbiGii toxin family protein [Streptococcus oralis]KXU15057.1 Abortive infection protein AbiGII [Streptococcus oralis]
MKNAMQLKALVKNIAKDKGISAQIVLQNYMLERLLERISNSRYQNHFILKGGLLIASIVGLDTRATMDMDVTVKGQAVTVENLMKMFEEILKISIEDDISFEFKSIEEIREGDDYNGYRIHLVGNFAPMAVPVKIDVTTGDKITPKEIQYDYRTMFDGKKIPILAYNIETILAEKLETILSRGDQTTRPRDYYDVYILWKLQSTQINKKQLSLALKQTALKRKSIHVVLDSSNIMDIVQSSEVLQREWQKYQRTFDYAKGILFEDVCLSIREILSELQLEELLDD